MKPLRNGLGLWGLILVLGLAALFTTTGCGGFDSDEFFIEDGGGGAGPAPPPPPPPPPANGRIQFDFVLAKAIPAEATQLRFTGYNATNQVKYGPETRAKAAQIILDEVPTEVTSMQIIYLNAAGDVVGATGMAVVVEGGETLVINDPNFNDHATYVGSATCQQCHTTLHADFVQTGHPFKISKVAGGQMPTFPFSTILGGLEKIAGAVNTLGAPTSYAQVSYVIGGYGWKARWTDLNGYIVTGTAVQYNLDDASMSGYNPTVVDKKFDCGECHTTGWKPYDAVLNPNRQDDLPGMDGTFHATGIQCEACHGAGGVHMYTKSRNDITRVATPRTKAQLEAADQAYGSPVACSECHTRDGERNHANGYTSAAQTAGYTGTVGGRIQASGGLGQHHEQYDELLAINPDNVAGGSTRSSGFQSTMLVCTTCHDQHKPTIYKPGTPGRLGGGPGVKSSNADCMVCHPNNNPANSKHPAMGHLKCIDCHMPKMVKSATSKMSGGVAPVKVGDIKAHIFRIDLTRPDANQFTTDGKWTYPYLTAQFACHQCHDGYSAPGHAHDRTNQNESTFDFH